MGGGSARGPLFQFTMQPIDRRRRWREVVERAQCKAQLRQLRDPMAGDNIGMALTENKKKRCIVTIKNRDALSCARAIVTMRAHCHKDDGTNGFRQWDNLKRGLPVQQRQAQDLH